MKLILCQKIVYKYKIITVFNKNSHEIEVFYEKMHKVIFYLQNK